MFQPQILPSDPAQLAVAVQNELQRLALSLSQPADYAALKVLYAEPSRVFDGMIVLADGTSWNPGGGAGMYVRVGGAWKMLKTGDYLMLE